MKRMSIGLMVPLVISAVLSGCALRPSGADQERARMETAERPYRQPADERSVSELPSKPNWRDVLYRAFMANGDLEASFFEWKAAVERVDIASAWPNSNVALGYSYALGPGQMKTFDRMTFTGGFDSMKNLSFPTKVAQDGKVAFAQAQAAGERFRAAKFELQRRVLSAWADYTLISEQVRIQSDQVALAQAAFDTARARVQAGGSQSDLLRADIALREAKDVQRSTTAELNAARMALNGLLGRSPDAPLEAPRVQQVRDIPVDDSIILAAAVNENPELAALSYSVKGRQDALERARQEWIPDINPVASVTGGVAQMVGATIVLPTTITQINGGIREADAMLKASDATLRQSTREKNATFVATLVLLRDAQREAALFDQTVVPATGRIVASVRQQYATGTATYLDLLEAQRAQLNARLVAARASAMREKRLAELEALMGADVETLGGASEAIDDTAKANQTQPSKKSETIYEN